MFKKISSFFLGIIMAVSLVSSFGTFAKNVSQEREYEDDNFEKTINFINQRRNMKKYDKAFEIVKTTEKVIDLSKVFISENVSEDIVGASGECGEGVSWNLSDSGTLTISGNGYMYDYDITTEEYAPWLESFESIKSVVIKSGVKSIGSQAFIFCSNLTSVTIPSTVEYIGEFAFDSCVSLTSIKIPDSVEMIGLYAFSGSGIKTLNIPASVWFIDSGIISYCNSLEKITVDSSNEYYKSVSNCIIDTEGNVLIAACEGSTLPDGELYSIGLSAFEGIQSLSELNIPSCVVDISEGAFSDCTKLTSITVDSENENFYSKDNVLIRKKSSSVVLGCVNSVIPNDGTITAVEAFAFYNVQLTSDFIVPKSITEFGTYAFYGCKKLRVSKLSDNVTRIGAHAFDETQNYNLSGGWLNGILYIGQYAVSADPYPEKEFCKIKDGTVLMADEMFAGYPMLKNATFPDSLKKISDYAFAGCVSLSNVEFSPLNETIGECAFLGCVSLTSIELPEFLENMEMGAFSLCTSLSEIVIPKSVKAIGDGAFVHCTALNKITVKSEKTEIGEYAFGFNVNEETGEPQKNDSLVVYCKISSKAGTYARSNGFTVYPLPKEEKNHFYINVKNNTMPNIPAKKSVSEYSDEYLEYVEMSSFIFSVSKDGELMDKTDFISTGAVIKICDFVFKEYIAIVNGDVDGNGIVDATDYLQVKKAFLKEIQLEGVYLTAADTNGDEIVNSTDYLQIKNYFLGEYNLY